MGILTRFTDIMKSNINALLDKCEDPAKMIDQTLRDLREDLAEVKKETANIIADAKSADRQVKECVEEITKYTTAAQNALKAGNEDDARTLIAKKQQYESNLVSYKKTQELTHANADKMRQMHDKLVNDIETLEARRDAIKATVASAKAQEHINKIVSGGDKAKSSMESFERYEKKAEKRRVSRPRRHCRRGDGAIAALSHRLYTAARSAGAVARDAYLGALVHHRYGRHTA